MTLGTADADLSVRDFIMDGSQYFVCGHTDSASLLADFTARNNAAFFASVGADQMIGYARGISLGALTIDSARACLASGTTFTMLGVSEAAGTTSAFISFTTGANLDASFYINSGANQVTPVQISGGAAFQDEKFIRFTLNEPPDAHLIASIHFDSTTVVVNFQSVLVGSMHCPCRFADMDHVGNELLFVSEVTISASAQLLIRTLDTSNNGVVLQTITFIPGFAAIDAKVSNNAAPMVVVNDGASKLRIITFDSAATLAPQMAQDLELLLASSVILLDLDYQGSYWIILA